MVLVAWASSFIYIPSFLHFSKIIQRVECICFLLQEIVDRAPANWYNIQSCSFRFPCLWFFKFSPWSNFSTAFDINETLRIFLHFIFFLFEIFIYIFRFKRWRPGREGGFHACSPHFLFMFWTKHNLHQDKCSMIKVTPWMVQRVNL